VLRRRHAIRARATQHTDQLSGLPRLVCAGLAGRRAEQHPRRRRRL
jgi:hypothetical protein